MIIETFLYNMTKTQNINELSKNKKIKLYILLICKIITTLIAVYLTMDCNKNSSLFFKIITFLIALLFSDLYIIYYIVFRIILMSLDTWIPNPS